MTAPDHDDRLNDPSSDAPGSDTDAGDVSASNGVRSVDDGHPEPPPSWKGDAVGWDSGHSGPSRDPQQSNSWKPNNTNTRSLSGNIGDSGQNADLERVRRDVSIGQISAIVSFFFGGVILSLIAIGFLASARMTIKRLDEAGSVEQDALAGIRRTWGAAVGIAVLALVVNIVSIVFMYPLVMQQVQSGGYGGLFGSGSGAGAGSTGNVTWG